MEELTPSGRELEILKVLWGWCGSVREVHQRMCPHHELAFNTVQTLLRIMDDKGLIVHRKQGRTFVYTPCYSRRRAASRSPPSRLRRRPGPSGVTLLNTADPMCRTRSNWKRSFRKPVAAKNAKLRVESRESV